MLWHILDAHDGQLPEGVRVVFCNTGKERPETLDFVKECGERWAVHIDWLEYRYIRDRAGGRKDPKSIHIVVTHESASREGQPFLSLIHKGEILPNAVTRKCTAELKVETVRRFIDRDLGWRRKDLRNVLGIRYDEPRRWRKALVEHCTTEYPMVHARVTRKDVTAFWERQPFDLGIPSDLGNCDLCFMKGTGKLMHAMRQDPTLADWWMDLEEKTSAEWESRLNKKEMARFSKRWTYRELRDRALATPELPGLEDESDVELPVM